MTAATPKRPTALEMPVLRALEECTYPDERYASFARIGSHDGLDRSVVRRACRALTRKGLAAFSSGLWDEDGQPAGSGYAITKDGIAALALAAQGPERGKTAGGRADG